MKAHERPRPFGNASRIAGPTGRALLGLCYGGIDVCRPTIPPPVSGTWGDFSFDGGDTELEITDDGDLNLLLVGLHWGRKDGLWKMAGRYNEPSSFKMADGSTLSCRLSAWVGRNMNMNVAEQAARCTHTISLVDWHWTRPVKPNLWVGKPQGVRLEDRNLAIVHQSGAWSARHLAIKANYDIYFVERDKEVFMLVDTGEADLDHGILSTDFRALEFALGRPMRLDFMLGLDDALEVTAAAGVQLGGHRVGRGRCPVPVYQDVIATDDEVAARHQWTPHLAGLVAKKLIEDGDDSPLQLATVAYLDSMTGHIHANYLLAQVALEAFCTKVVEAKAGVLVENSKNWLSFVEKIRDDIVAHAVDDEAGRKLVNKVKSAQHAPSGDRVHTALDHFGLDVPDGALKEVTKRGGAAHGFVMAKESTADAQNLADRLATIQTLLVAVVAKHVGYEGPIVGWKWRNGRRTIPAWWKWKAAPDAEIRYEVDETDLEP